jgi:hypothetical protein
MLMKLAGQSQIAMSKTVIICLINPEHVPCHPANKIELESIENEFVPFMEREEGLLFLSRQ